MSNNWELLKSLYIEDHLSKQLKKPATRLGALANLDELIKEYIPEIISNAEFLKRFEKKELYHRLETFKGSPLNSAEKSVITGLYKFLPHLNTQVEHIYTVEISKGAGLLTKQSPKNIFYHNLAKIVGEAIGKQILYEISHTIPSLKATPLPHQFPKTWKYLKEAYAQLNGFGLDLDQVIAENQSSLKMGRQEADVFITSPLKVVVEYDEKQHFNPFRGLTLQSEMYQNWKGFDVAHYQALCDIPEKWGSKKSGFFYLKSADPLFPEKPINDKQNNRLRQRAFRDMVKDAWSIEQNWEPTIRVPASIVGWKRKGLNQTNWQSINHYLSFINEE